MQDLLLKLCRWLDRGNGSAIVDALGAGDRGREGRYQEGDEVRHLTWLCWSRNWNAAERLHDVLFANIIARAGLLREAPRKSAVSMAWASWVRYVAQPEIRGEPVDRVS